MKHKIKKNRLKIFIVLSLMITTIFGVMFATNTFAYESDKISYTITTLSGNDFSTYDEIDNNNQYIDVNYGNDLYLFNSNSLISYKKYYFCINFIYLDNNNEPYASHSVSRSYCQPNAYINGGYKPAQGVYYNNYAYNYNGTYYTQIIPITLTSNYNSDIIKFLIPTFGGHIRIYNVDIVSDNDLGLAQYYETYYSQIEEQYDQLLEDYNDLEDDYNNLQQQYDEINEQYNSVIDVASIGIWDYINTLYWRSNGGGDYELSKQDLLDNHFISGNMLDFSVLVDLYPSPTNEYNFVMIFNSSFPLNVNLINIYVEMSDLTYHDVLSDTYMPIDFYFQLGHIENNYVANSVQPVVLWFNKADILPYNNYVNRQYIENQGTYLDYYNAFTNISLGNFMKFNSTDTLKFYSYNTQYQIGYQQGLNESNNISKNYYESIIDTKNTEINSLNSNIEQLERANTILQQQVATSDSYNLNNLIWTIGATPFESFKHIWNVNFFGVNIADFVLGLITFFIGLFVVKKFFL